MPAIRTHWTRGDLDRLPDDGNRYEVLRGELYVTPAPGPRHEYVIEALANHLRTLLAPAQTLRVYSSNAAVVLEDSQVIPDIQVCAHVTPPPDRWDDMPKPVLVVEVLSEVTRRRDLVAKRTLYGDVGIEYWMVDPDERAISVVVTGGAEQHTKAFDWLPPGAPAPLRVNVAAVFREALGG